MTGADQMLVYVAIVGLSVFAWVVWREYRRSEGTRLESAEYEDELDQEFGGNSETTDPEATTLLPLPDEDLVGPFVGDADPPGASAAGAETGRVRAQDVHGADAVRSGHAAEPYPRLTPAQRRRAVKKGRIPRNVPAVVGRESDTGHHSGALELAGPVSRPAPGPGEHHERIPLPLEVWDPLMRAWMPVFPTLLESARHEAHFRQWETEMGSLIDGAYAWLEAAA